MRKSFLNSSNTTSNFTLLYTCLTLLLLCFFIFLVVNSVIDPQRKKIAIGSLIGAFGSFNSGISIMGDAKQEELGFTLIPLSKNKKLVEDLLEIIKFYKVDKIVSIESKENDIILKFAQNSIFYKNTPNIRRKFFLALNRMLNRLKKEQDLKIEILSFYQDSYIGIYRAFNIANFFINNGKINKNKVLSYSQPLNNNYDLIVRFSGQGAFKSAESNQINYGDFIFKVK